MFYQKNQCCKMHHNFGAEWWIKKELCTQTSSNAEMSNNFSWSKECNTTLQLPNLCKHDSGNELKLTNAWYIYAVHGII